MATAEATTMGMFELLHREACCISWRCAGDGFMERASHALVDDGRVWLVDPIDADGIEGLLAELGKVEAVVVLLDRHLRDGLDFAGRHGVPLWIPDGSRGMSGAAGVDVRDYDLELPDSPFVVLEVRQLDRVWVERALWWPAERVLVAADCVGSAAYFRSLHEEQLAVHPLLRLAPPRQLRAVEPRLVLTGHGDPIAHGAASALRIALDESRRELPSYALKAPLHALRWARFLAGAGPRC